MFRTHRHLGPVALALVGMLGFAGTAHATTFTVNVETDFDVLGTTGTGSDLVDVDVPGDSDVEVGPCTLFTGVCSNPTLLQIDINPVSNSLTTIAITLLEYNGQGSQNLFRFTGLDWISIDAVTDAFDPGISGPIAVQFASHEVSVELKSVEVLGAGTVTLNLHQRQGQAPEPSALLLLGVGFASLVARRRKV